MKVAFVGKGGSGKTTVSSLFVRRLIERRLPVVAIDADINQQLGEALGLSEELLAGIPSLGDNLASIKEYLRGSNPLIPSASVMIKTTPPGYGSRLLRLHGDDPIHTGLTAALAPNAALMVTGNFTEDDLGVACYHSKTGAVELYLNHLVDEANEYVAVDMTAGADSFASGLFTRFDLLVLVAEPTRKGVGVYRQYVEYARDFNVAIRVVGNKVESDEDIAYLREQVGDNLITWLYRSPAVRALEQGRKARLEPVNVAALDRILEEVDARPKDWDTYYRQAIEFHQRNAQSWAGSELQMQIDPTFRYPAAIAPTR